MYPALLAVLFFLSCSKNAERDPTPMVEFTIEGTSFQWKEQLNANDPNYRRMTIYSNGMGQHLFFASTESSVFMNKPNQEIMITINTDSLEVNKTYTVRYEDGQAFSIIAGSAPGSNPAMTFLPYQEGDQCTITFTRIADGRAEGQFAARLTRWSDRTQVDVRDGMFRNIPIE
jgi:hypothetical protein